MPGFFISTPPRSGTHLLVDSIADATKSHSARFTTYDETFWKHPTVRNRPDAVIGIHAHDSNSRLLSFAQTKKIITTERHPLGQALSILFMYHRGFTPDWPNNLIFNSNNFLKMTPNSKEFLDYIKGTQFLSYREINSQWAPYGKSFSFDKLVDEDPEELNRLSDYVGADVKLRSIESSRKKYNDGIVFMGDPHLWKTIISKEIADEVAKLFPDYDMTTYQASAADGDWLFKQLLV
jgi:hypothetical protein